MCVFPDDPESYNPIGQIDFFKFPNAADEHVESPNRTPATAAEHIADILASNRPLLLNININPELRYEYNGKRLITRMMLRSASLKFDYEKSGS